MPDPNAEAQRELDEALAATFPASDPPAMTAPAIASPASEQHVGEPGTCRQCGLYRVVHGDESDSPFDSVGNRSGGRWTSPGTPAVYASLTPAGAILEFLAHMDGEQPLDLALVSASIPEECILAGDALPPRWREMPYRSEVRDYGDAWTASRRSLALRLPSVICERSQNLLINPEHPDIDRIQVTAIETFTLDPRLLGP